MGKDIVETRTFDFDKMLRDQARAATHPAAIAPLIALARQASSHGTARALQRVEKALAKQVARDERRTAKELAKLEREAAGRQRAATPQQQYQPPIVEHKPAHFCKPGETRDQALRRMYKEAGVDYNRHSGTYVSCTSGEYGNPTPACMRSIVPD